MARMTGLMKIGELATRCGVSNDTVRFYEREGLLPRPRRSPSSYRVFGEDDEQRLRFIRQAQANGLTLADVREMPGTNRVGRVLLWLATVVVAFGEGTEREEVSLGELLHGRHD